VPELELRPVGAADFPAYLATLRAAFHGSVIEDEAELEQAVFEPARSLAVFDGGAMVATAGAYSRELTVPGGPVPVAAVTFVGVRPTHRRRGLLTRMMRRQLADVHAEGREAIAALWASEGRIYGRFGYAVASRAAELRVRTEGVRLRTDPALPPATDPGDDREPLAAVYEAVRPDRPGLLDRTAPWWDLRLHDPDARNTARPPTGPLIVAVQLGHDGAPAGYALYAVKTAWRQGRPDGEVVVRELVARTPEAHAALWRHLLGLDLTTRVTWELAPPDEPLGLMLDDLSAVRAELGTGLWVRLVDVGRALAERAYAAPVDVVLEVHDDVCPWNAGRRRLAAGASGAVCEPTTAPADLALGVDALGSAYLGGVTLSALAAAGRVEERRQGALAAASRAFRGDAEPWCPEIF
jgi:predicted acetyltransferase